jgi:hypothetical protein
VRKYFFYRRARGQTRTLVGLGHTPALDSIQIQTICGIASSLSNS